MSYNYGKMAGAPKGLCGGGWPTKEVREHYMKQMEECRKLMENSKNDPDDFDFDFDDEEEIFN